MRPALGVQMFTLRRYTQTLDDLKAALDRIRTIGYRSIQVSAFGDITADDVARACREAGLEIGGTHIPWDRLRHDTERVIEEHQLWDCRHAAVGMIPPKIYLSLDGLDQFVTELTPVAEKLGAAGIDFSYHNHAHEFRRFDGQPWLARLFEAAPASMLKAELDTHWIVAGGGDPVEWIARVGDRMPLLHLKDFVIGDDLERRFAPVGDGNMNFDAIIREALEHPIEYWFVEQDTCYGEDEFACLERSYTFLSSHGLS